MFIHIFEIILTYERTRANPPNSKQLTTDPLHVGENAANLGGTTIRSQFPEKISFALPPRLAAFPRCARGLLTFSGKGVGMEFGERTRMIAHTNHRTQTT